MTPLHGVFGPRWPLSPLYFYGLSSVFLGRPNVDPSAFSFPSRPPLVGVRNRFVSIQPSFCAPPPPAIPLTRLAGQSGAMQVPPLKQGRPFTRDPPPPWPFISQIRTLVPPTGFFCFSRQNPLPPNDDPALPNFDIPDSFPPTKHWLGSEKNEDANSSSLCFPDVSQLRTTRRSFP